MEGDILDACRVLIGPAVPLVATLDLHANVTERMVRAADALVLYHTAPHIDVFETGQRGAAVLRRILDGARPVTAFQKLPLVVPAERANTQDPESVSYGIRELLQSWERDPRVLAAGLATVQPWLDIPDLGAAVVVVTDGDAELARERCARTWRRSSGSGDGITCRSWRRWKKACASRSPSRPASSSSATAPTRRHPARPATATICSARC